MASSLTAVIADPVKAAEAVSGASPLWRCKSMVDAETLSGFHLVMRPPEPFRSEGYPIECAWLFVRATGEVVAVPPEARRRRTWLHRDETRGRAGIHVDGPLCLDYPDDPPDLRWSWDGRGLEELVLVVHRHLLYEEYYRRTGEWPVEDAPHGQPRRGRHPVRSQEARHIIRRQTA